MKFSRIEDELESLQICEDFNSRLDSFWNSLPEESQLNVKRAHDYSVCDEIIVDAFAASGVPVNIL